MIRLRLRPALRWVPLVGMLIRRLLGLLGLPHLVDVTGLTEKEDRSKLTTGISPIWKWTMKFNRLCTKRCAPFGEK